jgi:hypothetical protein
MFFALTEKAHSGKVIAHMASRREAPPQFETIFKRIAVSARVAQMRALAADFSVPRGKIPNELLSTFDKFRRIERQATPRSFDDIYRNAMNVLALESQQTSTSPEAQFLQGQSNAMLECLQWTPGSVPGETIDTVMTTYEIVKLLLENEADMIVVDEESTTQRAITFHSREELLGREIGLRWVLGLRKNLLMLENGRLRRFQTPKKTPQRS